MTGRRALVTGASGYIGGLLVPELLAAGWVVRVLTRSSSSVADRPWADRVEVSTGDASRADDLRSALADVDVAYYLLHSMSAGPHFRDKDRELAETFAREAGAAGVSRIVYLGGLHPDGELSAHLASRVEVGEILLAGPTPTAVLQAGIVLGHGSASYDMLRHLSERLPAMVAPRWLTNRIQPIAIADVLHYLVQAAGLAPQLNRSFDIGGPDVLTYAQMMRGYARAAGLPRRLIVTLPVLTPGLASHWIGLVTPVDAGVAKPLIGSLIHDAVADEDDLAAMVAPPPGGRTGFAESLRAAMRDYDPQRWRRTLARTCAAVLATAVAGSLLTTPRDDWYSGLDKPRWQPPPAAFPVVWTSLYGAIAVAGTAAQAELPQAASRAFWRALLVNLGLNAGWSGIFFRAHRLGPASVGAGVLAASAADLARRAARSGRGKAVVFGAYAAWCSFATVLSADVARRNRRT